MSDWVGMVASFGAGISFTLLVGYLVTLNQDARAHRRTIEGWRERVLAERVDDLPSIESVEDDHGK